MQNTLHLKIKVHYVNKRFIDICLKIHVNEILFFSGGRVWTRCPEYLQLPAVLSFALAWRDTDNKLFINSFCNCFSPSFMTLSLSSTQAWWYIASIIQAWMI